MRILKIVIALLVVCLIVLIAAGCTSSNSTTATPTIRNVTVSPGNIANNVTGTANLALAKTQEVSFTIGGTVDTVAVALYDSVKTGDVLATLDTSAWESQIQTLNKNMVTAQKNVTTKETALLKTQRTVAAAEFALKQKEMDLQSAKSNLLAMTEIKAAQDLVDKAQLALDIARTTQQIEAIANPATAGEWTKVIKSYQEALNQAQANLRAVISGTASGLSSVTVLQIAKAQLAIETSQNALNDAYTAINDAYAAVAAAQVELAEAKAAIADIQKQIDDIKANNPKVTAPFDGIIISVNVKPGDTVAKGRTVFQVADPSQFQANFMVSEMDIFSVKVGQTARVSVDALSNQVFPAIVTAIAPLSTITQGVVNYQVTVRLTSLVPLSSSSGVAASAPSGSVALPEGFTPPAGFTPGSGTGRFTNLPSGTVRPSGFPTALPADSPRLSGTDRPASGGAINTAAASVSLKQGLTVSVTITIQEKNNVLLVPNRAITKAGGVSTVQLVSGTSVVNQTVETGLSDSTNTEITEGLKAGDIVQVKITSSSASTNILGPAGVGSGQRIQIR